MKGKCINCEVEFEYNPKQKFGKYCSNKCQGDYSVKQKFTKDSKWHQNMSTYLRDKRGSKCEVCGITNHNGKPIVMHVDHIDGDRTNNIFENLKVICPNCHSQTKTWGVRNVSEAGRQRMIEGGKHFASIKNKKGD
jgi:5-methylcytosine-specific restriction endonuclease McrA